MYSETSSTFDIDCKMCPRLVNYLSSVKRKFPLYYSAPVPAFGDTSPKVLIVGLAPGLHGANATGRPFTGDYAGELLYQTLFEFEFGFSNSPTSVDLNDGLELRDFRITNAVKCLPPKNKPIGSEINNCNQFLYHEIKELDGQGVILALGHLAHNAILRSLNLVRKDFEFAHHRVHHLSAVLKLVDSYHCSRYNVQTKRLTAEMFREVFSTVAKLTD